MGCCTASTMVYTERKRNEIFCGLNLFDRVEIYIFEIIT